MITSLVKHLLVAFAGLGAAIALDHILHDATISMLSGIALASFLVHFTHK